MGCGGSKLEEQPAVMLCKDRCNFLEEAVRLRFQFAESQLAYVQSLSKVGQSFHFLLLHTESTDSAPTLSLPVHQKGEANVSSKKHVTFHSNSNSHSGSHLEFHSDSDSDSDISHLHLHDHNGSLSPMVHQDPDPSGAPSTRVHASYMKSSRPTTSLVYDQRPVTSESVYYYGPGEGSSQYPISSYSTYSHSECPSYSFPGGGGDFSYEGYPTQYKPDVSAASSSSKPPPSPPRASAWDFLNLFEGNEYFGSHMNVSSSRNSKEVIDEGMPDLEDDVEVTHQSHDRSNGYFFQNEVVKEVIPKHPHPTYSSGSSSGTIGCDEADSPDNRYEGGRQEDLTEEKLGVVENGERPVEYEVHVVEKKVVGGVSEEANNKRPRGPLDVSQVVSEIESQFAHASASCNDVLHLLEPEHQPHRSRTSASRLLGMAPSFSVISSLPSISRQGSQISTSEVGKANKVLLELDEELAVRSRNLSATLHKLSLSEKKLYLEVKAEEKLRVSHEKNCKKLKRLDERGAESHKVDATRTLIRSLSTKMRMAIQVVDKISVAINTIRDDELWPQLLQLIQGLTKMWKSMLECHHIQCEAIRDARNVGSLGTTLQASEAFVDAAQELVRWTHSFSCWIDTQKRFAKALNNWLVKCILYEPEHTVDGTVPFSPGRLGAPPVFVICNQWAQTIANISEKEVLEAMYSFTVGVLQLCERSGIETHHRVVTNKDLERKAKSIEREDLKIQKEIVTLGKEIDRIAADGNVLAAIEVGELRGEAPRNLQDCMQQIFEALKRFMSDSVKVYEDLVQRAEEQTRV